MRLKTRDLTTVTYSTPVSSNGVHQKLRWRESDDSSGPMTLVTRRDTLWPQRPANLSTLSYYGKLPQWFRSNVRKSEWIDVSQESNFQRLNHKHSSSPTATQLRFATAQDVRTKIMKTRAQFWGEANDMCCLVYIYIYIVKFWLDSSKNLVFCSEAENSRSPTLLFNLKFNWTEIQVKILLE